MLPKIDSSKVSDRPSNLPFFNWDSVKQENQLGSGRYADVYLYKSSTYGNVAMKCLKNEYALVKNGFFKEATLLHSLSHENIVHFFGLSKTGTYAMMLEYVVFDMALFGVQDHVHSLADLLERFNKYGYENFQHVQFHIAKGVIRGLHYIHQEGVAHRDLKPHNILVSNLHILGHTSDKDRTQVWESNPIKIKLTDFGEGRSQLIQTQTVAHTQTMSIYKGSPVFMAPEILMNVHGGKVTPVGINELKAMDIWSLSMVLYILLNPNIAHPYHTELQQCLGTTTVQVERHIVMLLTEGRLPVHGQQYSEMRKGVWKNINELYDFAAVIEWQKRPTIINIYRKLERMCNQDYEGTDGNLPDNERTDDGMTGDGKTGVMVDDGETDDGRSGDERDDSGKTDYGRNGDRMGDGWTSDGRTDNEETGDGRTEGLLTKDRRSDDASSDYMRIDNVVTDYGRTDEGNAIDRRIDEGMNDKRIDDRRNDGRTDDGRTDHERTDDGRKYDGKADNGRIDVGRAKDGKTSDERTDYVVADGKTDNGMNNVGKNNRTDSGMTAKRTDCERNSDGRMDVRAYYGRIDDGRTDDKMTGNGRNAYGRAENERTECERPCDRMTAGEKTDGGTDGERLGTDGRNDDGRASYGKTGNEDIDNGRLDGRTNNERTCDGMAGRRIYEGTMNDNGKTNNEKTDDGRIDNGRLGGRTNDKSTYHGKTGVISVGNRRTGCGMSDNRTDYGGTNHERTDRRTNYERIGNGITGKGRINNGKTDGTDDGRTDYEKNDGSTEERSDYSSCDGMIDGRTDFGRTYQGETGHGRTIGKGRGGKTGDGMIRRVMTGSRLTVDDGESYIENEDQDVELVEENSTRRYNHGKINRADNGKTDGSGSDGTDVELLEENSTSRYDPGKMDRADNGKVAGRSDYGRSGDRRIDGSTSDGKDVDPEENSSSSQKFYGWTNLDLLPMKCSQASELENFDRFVAECLNEYPNGLEDMSFKFPAKDATNACAFLCIMIGERFVSQSQTTVEALQEIAHAAIEDFPEGLNEMRDKDRGYEACEALEMLQYLELVPTTFHVTFKLQQKFDSTADTLLTKEWSGCNSNEFSVFVLTCSPYTLLMLYNNNKIYILDTHPVPESLGGTSNGLIVSADNTTSGHADIMDWLHRRFKGSGPYFQVQQLSQKDEAVQSVDSSSEDDWELSNVTKVRQELRPANWDDCKEENEIPYDVNGHKKYRLSATKSTMMKVSTDGRPWGTWYNSTRVGYNGVRRAVKCNGTPVCNNESCKIEGKPNRGQFLKKKGSVLCKICQNEAEMVDCPARKVWEYKDNEVVVMYTGDHTCIPQKKGISSKQLMQEFKQQAQHTSANQFVLGKMTKLMSSENVDWESVDYVASRFVNIKRLNNAKSRVFSNDSGNSYDAVCQFKKQTDKRDKYLVYKVNNGQMNNDLPSYVFKSSTAMAKIGLDMDRERSTQRSKSYAFIDAKHERTLGMKTLTLWTYDPTLQRVLCLAIMDTEEENTSTISLFWRYWNQILQEISGNPTYQFNPTGWMLDEHQGQWNALRNVYGEDAMKRAFSCEFHFKKNVNKQATKFSDPQKFKDLCMKMLHACTVSEYNKCHQELNEICQDSSWLKWWHKRKDHVFRAFKPDDAPNTNYAEIGHAQLAKMCNNQQVLLLRACRDDVALAVRQEKEIEAITTGQANLGRGPSNDDVQRRSHKRQMRQAKAYGENLSGTEDEGTTPSSSVQPSKRKKSKQNDKGKKRRKKDKNKSGGKLVSAKYRKDLPPLSAHQQQELRDAPLILYRRHGTIRKCHGCEEPLQATMQAPDDLILRRLDYREFKQDGLWYRQTFLSYTYYDLSMSCVRKKYPSTELSSILILDDLHLRKRHIKKLHEKGIHIKCKNCSD